MKLNQPELDLDPAHPPWIKTDSEEEFFALCDRQDARELRIESIERGKGNGQWICRVRYGC